MTNPADWPTSIVALADLKPYLNQPTSDTSNDTELQLFIDAATPIIEDIVGTVVPSPFDEWYDGGEVAIRLRHRPILEVNGVDEYWGRVRYTLAPAPTPDQGSTYSYMWESPGWLVRRTTGGTRPFPPGPNAVHVQYTAGRATVPKNIKLGTLELIRHLFQQTQLGGRPSFSGSALEEGPAPSAGFAVPNRVLEILQADKRAPSVA